MTAPPLDRRTLLGAAVFVPLAAIASRAEAQVLGTEPAAASFRAIVVDTSPLLAFGGESSAAVLRQALIGQMQTVFADRLAPADRRSPILVARISHLYLASFGGENSFGDVGPYDNIEGDGLVSAGKRILSSTHVLTELSPSYSGAFNTPGIDRLRYDSIAHQFAHWLRREMNI